MYTGPDSMPYTSVLPPWPHLVSILQQMGMSNEAAMIAAAMKSIGWRG